MTKITYKTVAVQSGKNIILFRITDRSGAYIEVLNYGATLVSIVVPDHSGHLDNIILNYSDIRDYFTDTNYLGSTIGRFANRIANAQFTLNGNVYLLDKNDGKNCNHSGYSGFHQKIFDAEICDEELVLSTHSPDGEGGFPGNMDVAVHFSFHDQTLTIKYAVLPDQDTVFSPTCHAYFNLSGHKNSVFSHELQVNATEYLEMDSSFLPTGKILPVANTAFDFSQCHSIGQMATHKYDVLKGYNTYFPVPGNSKLRQMVSLKELMSGRRMAVSSTMPGIMLYTGDYLCRQHAPFDGLCLEAQFYPDTPNHALFPACTIRRNELQEQTIVFRFDIV